MNSPIASFINVLGRHAPSSPPNRNRLGRWLLCSAATLLGLCAAAAPTLYTIGDSTVKTYEPQYYPRAGWGQVLPHFFQADQLTVINRAVGGTSSRTFYNNGYWVDLKKVLNPGDYVTIQFGINDSSTDPRHTDPQTSFKDFLRRFVNETRAKGAFPILVTTQNRNAWTATNPPTVVLTYAAYAAATREVAAEMSVPLIDLERRSKALMEQVGKDYSTYFFFHNYPAGEWPNFPNGASDNVHFQEMGAIEMARLVVDEIRGLSSDPNVAPLIGYLRPTYAVTFATNNPAAGLVSRSASFPSGITVTAYVRPAADYTFLHWSGAISGTSRHQTFAMGTAARTITANFTGGSVALQIEDGSMGGGVLIERNHAGYEGTGFANFPKSGGYVQFSNIDGGAGGSSTLSFRHALGVTGTRTGMLTVNGVDQPITFASTGSWSSWQLATATVMLHSGIANVIRLSSNGQDLANVDAMTIAPAAAAARTYPAESASRAGGVTIDTNIGGYHGTGFANFPANGGTLTFDSLDGHGGGAKSVTVRYANGGPAARTGTITVNGVASAITFPTTGAWGNWRTLVVELTLNAGTGNSIRLASTGSDLANVDEITVP